MNKADQRDDNKSKHNPLKKVLFLTPYPHDTAPGQRFRFEQYFDILRQNGIEYEEASFMGHATWDILYKKGLVLKKVWGILSGWLRRILMISRVRRYDFIFIFREASPLGPPIFEWLISKVFKKKIIYDFDDAIWLPNTSESNMLISDAKWHSKVASICKWSHKISCGNAYLAEYARQFNKNVIINPTTIDTVNYHNKIKDQHTPTLTIGWTGTHSTVHYLDAIVPVLQKLEKEFKFTFVVISDAPPSFELHSLKFKKWHKDTEIDDLMEFNIGVMPLTDDAWAKGKCGFKALQYMSLGIPPLVSPIGVNTSIVDHGVNGMICNTAQEWELALRAFITDHELRIRRGVKAREKVEKEYSVLSNTSNFLSLFEY